MDERTTLEVETSVNVPEPAVPLPVRQQIVLSPINRRRWDNFKANRRGFYALWIFLALFLVTLFAECIANDKPFMIEIGLL